MGVIVDSSVVIAAERGGSDAQAALAWIADQLPGEVVALSVITLLELAHGVARANSTERRTSRRNFLNDLSAALPVHHITAAVALRAGEMDGDQCSAGIRLPLGDLLIGATAVELGYSVATRNTRHFAMIPGLKIVSF